MSGSPAFPSLLQSLKRLDVYGRIPDSLTEQTAAGAGVSIVSVLIVLTLFLSEFVAYMRVDVEHQMLVEHPLQAALAAGLAGAAYDSSVLTINFNITTPRMPCAITSVGVQDVLGTQIDVAAVVQKFRTDAFGQLQFDASGNPSIDRDDQAPQHAARAQVNEGCCVVGHVRVPRVPGALHITSTARPEMMQLFFQQTAPASTTGIGGSLNTSHIVNSLWFGDTLALKEIDAAALAPLNGATKWSRADEMTNGNEKSYEYFIQIIPTMIQRLRGPPIHSFQFVSNSNEILGRFRMPAIFFRFDVEPITVRFVETTTAFSHFAVQCCAIVGGAIALLGLVNSGLPDLFKALKPASSKGAHSRER